MVERFLPSERTSWRAKRCQRHCVTWQCFAFKWFKRRSLLFQKGHSWNCLIRLKPCPKTGHKAWDSFLGPTPPTLGNKAESFFRENDGGSPSLLFSPFLGPRWGLREFIMPKFVKSKTKVPTTASHSDAIHGFSELSLKIERWFFLWCKTTQRFLKKFHCQ